ncbi:hypothetical protein PIECOFPK_02575 [Mycovorax composti]|jgi:hypothetical protein|uniref:DUF4878 domain-containing protein n=2 Tax=Chitinophagaceae TaxID=563835 RepID=A0ABZ2EMM5_9BACT
MTKQLLLFITVWGLLVGVSCNSGSSQDEADSDLDAARNFLEASLKGRYDRAADFMLRDSINNQQLDAVSRIQLSSEERQGLWDASIHIHNRQLLNDSTSIIVYSNSFHKDNRDTLKVVRKDGKWLVDFKYLFESKEGAFEN